jgi:hypothetical protein
MLHDMTNPTREDRYLGDASTLAARVGIVVSGIGLGLGLFLAYGSDEGVPRFLHAYLTSFCYFLSLSLGALFFVILQHLTRSGWSVVVRRIAEAIAANMLLLAALCVPILAGMKHLYPWADAAAVAGDPLLHGKQPYLNMPFFAARLVVYFVAWIMLAAFFRRNSVRQDATGDVALTLRMQKWSAPAMLIFAATLTFAAFDLLMSLDPHWYSTIFGVYYFSGGVLGFFALLALAASSLQAAGRLSRAVTAEHYHDLGKLVFAFTIFWAYIAFSQYVLIWYANIPEETTWYLRRQGGDWVAVGLLLVFGHFLVPFLALMSRAPKRRPAVLSACAVWVLLVHWVDLYWLVVPQISPQNAAPAMVDAACFVGIGGLFVAVTILRLRRHALIPLRDPRLLESLTFENV